MSSFYSSLMGRAALGAGLLGALIGPASAQVGNGSFETGAFAPSWTTIGTASVVTASFGQAPTSGTYQAFISNVPVNPPSDTEATTAQLQTFLGLGSTALTNYKSAQPTLLFTATDITGGGAIKQTFTGQAGQTLSFDYDYLTSQDPTNPPYYPDYAFVTLNGGLTQLAQSTNALVPTPTDATKPIYNYLTQTTYALSHYSVTLPTTGQYTLGLAVTETHGSGLGSALLIDNVKLTAAPEPSVGAMGLALLISVGGLMARRRRAGARV